eukprot:1101721-Rhodomonas_salina.1
MACVLTAISTERDLLTRRRTEEEEGLGVEQGGREREGREGGDIGARDREAPRSGTGIGAET